MDDQPIPGVGGVAGEPSRRQGGYRSGKRPPARGASEQRPSPPPAAETPPVPAADPDEPTSSLVEALDRLRATEGPQPAEAELTRHLRGARYYQEESRHGLPVVGAEAPPSEPPTAPAPPE